MKPEFENGAFEPGVYVKGQVARRAETPSEAAKYVWDGYVRQADEAPKSEKVEAPSESESESTDAPSEPEKRGPGRPRKPAGGDQ